MQERAVAIVTRFISKERRAILSRSILSPQNTIAVRGAIHGRDATRSIRLAGKCDINANSLVWIAPWLGFADHNLLNLTILSKIFLASKRLQQLVLVTDCGIEAYDVNQVLLHNTNTCQILPAGSLYLTPFGFLLLGCSSLAGLQGQIGFEPKLRKEGSVHLEICE
jgi:hypothetical protein